VFLTAQANGAQAKAMRYVNALLLLLTSVAFAQTPQRPRIPGVANIGVRTDNLDAARKFYGEELGYEEAFRIEKPEMVVFKVNDHQYIQVFPGWKGPEQLVLDHIAFETDNAKQLHDYLVSKGVKASDAKKGVDGALEFSIQDPDGHEVQFVEYVKGSLEARNFGKHLPATRVSERIIHVGTTTSDQAAFNALYRDILGFHEIWHGGPTDTTTNWVDMRVPDGTDWLEYMMNVKNPSLRTLGVMNHMALGVPSVAEGYKTVMSRGLKPEPPKIGRDGKWQLNLYDPNQTRAELMEPEPVEKPCCSPFLK
jgi:catechol 2,3-dioxygenase-like lactoylglutathione lyase family enzyme